MTVKYFNSLACLTVCLMLVGTNVGRAQSEGDALKTTGKLELLDRLRLITNRLNQSELDADLVSQQRQVLLDLRKLLQIPENGDVQRSSESASTETQASSSGEKPASEPPPQPGSAKSGTGETPRPQSSDMKPLVKPDLADAVWGHLPAQEQQELIRTFNERFLPSYEEQIRNYFEILSKQDTTTGLNTPGKPTGNDPKQ